MAAFLASKVVSALPVTLAANTLYLVKRGPGFDLFATNDQGTIAAYEMNGETHPELHRYGYEFFTDFIQETSATATDGALSETNSGTGAAVSSAATDAANRPGVVQLSTGTTATGRSGLATALSAIRLGGGEWLYEAAVRIPTLSTPAERFYFAAGFFDTLTSVNSTDGAMIFYDEGGVSTGASAAGYFQTRTVASSGALLNSGLTQVPVVAGQWYRLGVLVNAAATEVKFHVDGNLIGTHASSIPSGAGRELGFGALLVKSIGTTARTALLDYLKATGAFSAAR